jgi:hypothetical protein
MRYEDCMTNTDITLNGKSCTYKLSYSTDRWVMEHTWVNSVNELYSRYEKMTFANLRDAIETFSIMTKVALEHNFLSQETYDEGMGKVQKLEEAH